MRPRRGLAVTFKLLLIIAGAIGCVVFLRQLSASDQRLLGTPRSPAASQPSGSGASPATGSGPVAPVNAPADDWIQLYRSMTLDQAFETVARQIRFEPYVGIQRGARGTARAQAGNALDHALLLAEILRATGYDVRLVHGSLSPENTAALLRGLYPPRVPSRDFDAAYLPYDATADTELVALVRDHYWLELNQGSTWLPLDPSFPRAKIGEAYGTAIDRFTDPPAGLYQRLEFAWKFDTAERGGQQVARWSGTIADLGLQPISLVVDTIPGSQGPPPPAAPSAGGMFGGALAGASTPKPTDQQPTAEQASTAIRYARSVETDARQPASANVSFLNRPGSLVQREYLEIRLTGPGGLNRTTERTLYEAEGETGSARAEHRRYTLLVVPGPVSQSFLDAETGRWRGALKLDEWRNEMAALQQQPRAGGGGRAGVEKAAAIDAVAGKTAGYLMTLDFAAHSDALTDQIAYPNQVAVVRPLPRILIASAETSVDASGHVASSVSLDLRLDEVQAYPYPGFPSRAVPLFLAGRGMQESVLEGQMVARWTGHEAVSTAALIAEANRNAIQLLEVDAEDRSELDAARGITPRARREIETAVNAGHEVIVPAQPITIAGRARWGWWDLDPASGAIIGVMEGGQHQAMAEYSISSQKIGLNDNNAFFLGAIAGSNATMFFVCAKLLETGTVTPELIAAVEAYVKNASCNTMCPAKAEASASAKLIVGDDCFKVDKIKGIKMAIGAKATLKFCAKYNEGFKCASGLILAGLKGQMPGIKLAAEAKITLPCGVGN